MNRPASGVGTDRLIRALQRGGMAVATASGRWDIYRDRDRRRRVVGALDGVAVEALRSTGALCSLGGSDSVLVWSGPLPEQDTGAPLPVPAAVRPDGTAGQRQRQQRQRSAMAQVLEALAEPGAAGRARNAALRLNGDLHRAATPQSVTMRWDIAGKVDASRSPGGAGMGQAALAAARRLSALRTALGEGAMAALVALVLHERPPTRIAVDAGWPPARAPRELARLLLRLADAYDQHTR